MKITIESTTKVVELNGVPARVWEGETDSGIPCHCFITRIAIKNNEPKQEEFKRELQETKAPTPEISSYPLKMIL